MIKRTARLSICAMLVIFVAGCKDEKKSDKQPLSLVEEKDFQGIWSARRSTPAKEIIFDLFLHVDGSRTLLDVTGNESLRCREYRDFTVINNELKLSASENCPGAVHAVQKFESVIYLDLDPSVGGTRYSLRKGDEELLQDLVSNAYAVVEDVPQPFEEYFIASQDDATIEARVKDAEPWLRTVSLEFNGPTPAGYVAFIVEGRLVENRPASKSFCVITDFKKLKEGESYKAPISQIVWRLPRRANNVWTLQASLGESAQGQFTTKSIFWNSIDFNSNDGKAQVSCIKPLTEDPWTVDELKAILIGSVFPK